MNRRAPPRKLPPALAAVALAVALTLAAARCDRTVPLGVAPESDAAALDGGADAGTSQ